MHLVGYLYEDYHDARSLEHKVKKKKFTCFVCSIKFAMFPPSPFCIKNLVF
jgi:hypothetical protein